MNIIDVGSGLMYKYKQLLNKYSTLKIYAFEADPHKYSKLCILEMEVNKDCDKKRLYIFNCVVSDNNGTCKLHVCNDSSSSSTLPFIITSIRKWKYPIGRRYFKTTRVIDVESVKLSDIIDKHHISQIDLLNIDTQGESLNVLQTLTIKYYRKIKIIRVKAHSELGFELYKGQCTAYDVSRLLKRYYFQLYNSQDCSRDQEQILTFKNEVLLNRGSHFNIFV